MKLLGLIGLTPAPLLCMYKYTLLSCCLTMTFVFTTTRGAGMQSRYIVCLTFSIYTCILILVYLFMCLIPDYGALASPLLLLTLPCGRNRPAVSQPCPLRG
ncbi:hypothetical protein F5Y10DRAFT_59261 [Nemania abortiva]|nr:hypothetical protein F5Y10DRAFT_59261 [Nemania abortiva]